MAQPEQKKVLVQSIDYCSNISVLKYFLVVFSTMTMMGGTIIRCQEEEKISNHFSVKWSVYFFLSPISFSDEKVLELVRLFAICTRLVTMAQISEIKSTTKRLQVKENIEKGQLT